MNGYGKLPILAADVSGALAILYGFAGLRIVCSAGSCGNNYVKFDEFRPAPEKNLYTTRMGMLHAVSGEEHVLEAIQNTDLGTEISFLALVGTSVPSIAGMELSAAAKRIERETGIPTVYVACDGFHSAGDGAAKLLRELGTRVGRKRKTRPKSVNLIGYDPLLHGDEKELAPLREWIREQRIQIACDWSAAKTLSDLEESAAAALNLVLSGSGLPLAEYMAEKFAIPYELVCPCGRTGLHQLTRIFGRYFQTPLESRLQEKPPQGNSPWRAVVLGEPVWAEGMKHLLVHELGIRDVQKFCYEEAAFSPAVRQRLPDARYEKISSLPKRLEELTSPCLVLGDPLFRRFVREGVRFIDFPDRRLSGSLFLASPWLGEKGSEYLSTTIYERSL